MTYLLLAALGFISYAALAEDAQKVYQSYGCYIEVPKDTKITSCKENIDFTVTCNGQDMKVMCPDDKDYSW